MILAQRASESTVHLARTLGATWCGRAIRANGETWGVYEAVGGGWRSRLCAECERAERTRSVTFRRARCEACGDTVDVEASLIAPEAKSSECCAGPRGGEEGRVHPPEDVTTRPLLCGSCGYEKEFGVMPKGQAKKKKGRGAANGAKPRIPTTHAAAKGADGAERKEKRRHHEKLPVIINASERSKHASELAKIVRERLALDERRRNVMAQFAKQKKFYDEQEERLSAAVDGGIETRSVECVDYLLPTNEIETIRLDTNEVIDRRAATAEELQEEDDDEPVDLDPEPAGGDEAIP